MTDLLARRRKKANIVDQLVETRRQVGDLQRSTAAPDDDGRLILPGLLLRVLAATPAAPPQGEVLMYVLEDAGVKYLRAMDSAGVVKTLDSWM